MLALTSASLRTMVKGPVKLATLEKMIFSEMPKRW